MNCPSLVWLAQIRIDRKLPFKNPIEPSRLKIRAYLNPHKSFG